MHVLIIVDADVKHTPFIKITLLVSALVLEIQILYRHQEIA
jgi:hypothetical protein